MNKSQCLYQLNGSGHEDDRMVNALSLWLSTGRDVGVTEGSFDQSGIS